MGPRKRWAAVYLAALAGAYFPLTRVGEPALREAWFRNVTRALVRDGATLSPPDGKMWLGASRPELPQSLYGIYDLQSRLGRPLAITSFYQAWGDREEHQFPAEVLRNMAEGGHIPMVTWEPWLSAFERWKGEVPTTSLRVIASGELDGYVRRWARGAVKHGAPFLLRPGHEPTNPWYSWSPEHGNTASDYRAFWQHVRRIFREEGARNVAFVWTPYGLADHDWFPGGDSVDWIGFDIFNYGSLSAQGTWLDFYSLTKLFYDSYRALLPRLLIAEVGTSSAGGNKADWARDMFQSLAANNFPQIRAVVLFDQPGGQTDNGLPVNWSLDEAEGTLAALARHPSLFSPYTHQRK